ncbi:MAG: cobalt-precorrin-5B (C(1))-methyltransferase CbiD [Candidatus Caldatribacteriaceae bacterium]
MDRYIVQQGKRLRCGYTTGSCAASASKMAAYLLFGGEYTEEISILNPLGEKLTLPIAEVKRGVSWVRCGVIKDGGDDLDVTSGLMVYAQVELIPQKEIVVEGGKGIGMVTKPGLTVAPGNWAINPGPLWMIHNAVQSVILNQKGVKITLSIPEGERVAQHTFNPRLGIIGGLSILGTTGIVEPLSSEGWKKTLDLELSMLRAQGFEEVILTPGNYGKEIAIKRGLPEDRIVKYGNLLGFALDKLLELGFTRVYLVGDLGKLIKVSGGIFYTDGRLVDGRMEIISAYAAMLGAPPLVIRKLLSLSTTEEALKILDQEGIDIETFGNLVGERIRSRCLEYTRGKIVVGVLLFSRQYGILAEVDINAERSRGGTR